MSVTPTPEPDRLSVKFAEKPTPLPGFESRLARAAELTKGASTVFFALLIAGFYCGLTIATTTDVALLTNSTATPLPIIQTNVPILYFYYLAPFVMFAAFVYFLFQLRQLWGEIAALPARHPLDRRPRQDYVHPWMVSSALMRAAGDGPAGSGEDSAPRQGSMPEFLVCVLLVWGFVPLILLGFCLRFLVRHETAGTAIHAGLFCLACFYAAYTLKEAWDLLSGAGGGGAAARRFKAIAMSAPVSLALIFLVWSAAGGAPASRCAEEGQALPGCERATATRILEASAVFNPFADFTELSISAMPDGLSPESVTDGSNLARVKGAQLKEANLEFVHAGRAALINANLKGANLYRADLRQAYLQGARLDKAQLIQARLEDARLFGANLSKANLNGTTLGGAKLGNVTANEAAFVKAKFGDAEIAGGDFEKAVFNFADLQGVTFNGARLAGAQFLEARMGNAKFEAVWIPGANFKNAAMISAVLRRCKGRKTVFDFARLSHADLSECELVDASFIKAELQSARLDNGNFTGADFSGAFLNRAALNGAVLRGATLSGASLDLAELDNADFTNAAGLSQEQLDRACGAAVTLPAALTVKPCARNRDRLMTPAR